LKKQSTSKRGKWECVLIDDALVHADHVVNCLIDICSHNYIQAVQCTYIVHNTGKCSIFIDTWDDCSEVQSELEQQGLTVIVTKYKKHV
jgi:ATP-dependent Clp protease adaptor protein ClpS